MFFIRLNRKVWNHNFFVDALSWKGCALSWNELVLGFLVRRQLLARIHELQQNSQFYDDKFSKSAFPPTPTNSRYESFRSASRSPTLTIYVLCYSGFSSEWMLLLCDGARWVRERGKERRGSFISLEHFVNLMRWIWRQHHPKRNGRRMAHSRARIAASQCCYLHSVCERYEPIHMFSTQIKVVWGRAALKVLFWDCIPVHCRLVLSLCLFLERIVPHSHIDAA